MEMVQTGIDALGDIAWGSHFCHFYEGHKDLVETLVPYFKAGLENNEFCIWVTSEPLLAQEARALLAAQVPRLDEFEAKGQIEIVNHSDWYLRTGTADADATLQLWVDKQYACLEKGFKGLRLTGNTYWLEKEDWKGFVEYEAKVNDTFSKHRIVGLCSYCVNRVGSHEVFDVVRNHDFALLRKDANWELIESVSSRGLTRNVEKLNLQLKKNMQKAKLEAEQANQLKTQFLANMSHEIRTPLGAILGFTELMREAELSEDDKSSFIEAIQRNGDSLSRLVDDFLDIAKIEANMLEVEKTPFVIDELVQDVISTFRIKAQAKSIALRAHVAPMLPTSMASDPNRIRQILVNLVGNSLKFTQQGAIELSVSAEMRKQKTCVVFRIRDTGIGMNGEAKAGLFQPFRQADGTTARKFGGTGLGLYLSRRLAQLLDGDIQLEHSEPGLGSTFTLIIEASELALRRETTPVPQPMDGRALNGFRILVAEDFADNRLLIAHILKNSGAQVQFATDGEEVLHCMEREKFDIVLMDLQMPKVDGYEALRRLRDGGFNNPVVALSAHAMTGDVKKSSQHGFDGHLTKPINRSELLKTLSHYHRSAGG